MEIKRISWVLLLYQRDVRGARIIKNRKNLMDCMTLERAQPHSQTMHNHENLQISNDFGIAFLPIHFTKHANA